jgi:hypothetical protein
MADKAENMMQLSGRDMLNIEVVYALPARQDVIRIQLPSGSTVQDAIAQSDILARHPEIDLAQSKLGIFAKLVKPDALLRDRDRVEIYRPLIADPKEVRKQQASKGRTMKKDGSSESMTA